MSDSNFDITDLIKKAAAGDKHSIEELWPKIYGELHKMAEFYFGKTGRCETMRPTVLVNEVYLKLINQKNASFNDRAHFFAMAATAMRSVLADYSRKKFSLKRGGKNVKMSLDEKVLATEAGSTEEMEIMVVHDLLTKLAAEDETLAKIAELKYFGGMEGDEIAKVMEISPSTVKRKWAAAKAWLYHEIGDGIKKTG